MSYRLVASMALLLASAPLLAAGQALTAAKATAAKKSWSPPRTPDGHPDLQGSWTNATTTPFERPQNLAGKEFFTPAEAAEYEKRALEPRKRPPGTEADVHYDLAQYGLDRSQAKVASTRRTSLVVGPDGKVPPMTAEAQKRNADLARERKEHLFDGPESRSLAERCILWPHEGPPMLPAGYNSNLQIVQGPGYVAILQEMIHDVRLIPTDGRPHLSNKIRQWMGDSRGHWEGNTLVVDVTNFTGKTAFRGSGENLHVVERFTPVDKDTILYEFTVDDPATWTRPWRAEIPMSRIQGAVYEYACHEGNYGLANILRAARLQEKKAAEAAKKVSQ